MLLYYVTGPRGVSRVAEAFAAGVDIVQVRARSDLFRMVARVAGMGRVLVNDRLDVALACGAAGVHLPGDRPPTSAYRPYARVISVACHSVDDVARAADDGADYALLAPVFDTPGKGAPLGLAALECASRLKIPVLALGGINLENARACMNAGASGVAAIRLFEDAPDLAEVVRLLRAT